MTEYVGTVLPAAKAVPVLVKTGPREYAEKIVPLSRFDGPHAGFFIKGSVCYFKSGFEDQSRVLHRSDGPAVERDDGSEEWWLEGKVHRSDGGPAIKDHEGTLEWWENGNLHREGDLPAIVHQSGSCEYWENGLKHRSHNPACSGGQGEDEWWVKGIFLEGWNLQNYKDAISEDTTPTHLGKLSRDDSFVVSEAAVRHPNCPPEDQVEWVLEHAQPKTFELHRLKRNSSEKFGFYPPANLDRRI